MGKRLRVRAWLAGGRSLAGEVLDYMTDRGVEWGEKEARGQSTGTVDSHVIRSETERKTQQWAVGKNNE